MNGISFSGASMALQIAALEVETTNQQQAADHAARNAARANRLAEMKAEEDSLREKAASIMQEAYVGGALRVGSGVAQYQAGSQEMSASTCNPASSTQSQVLESRSSALEARLAGNMCDGAAFVSEKISSAEQENLDADGASHRRMAEVAKDDVNDLDERMRQRDAQFSQKLSVLEALLNSTHDTELTIVRG